MRRFSKTVGSPRAIPGRNRFCINDLKDFEKSKFSIRIETQAIDDAETGQPESGGNLLPCGW
jgi:hypothetical protein